MNDIVSRLSLIEIMYQMAMGGAGTTGGPAPAIPRLGIGPYQWNEECLRGVAEAGEATAFPQSIGLGAAFSPQLIYDIAKATGTEVRAKHNDYVKRQVYSDHTGLSCFSPVINIMRHPLWGRNQETYGEDPFLSGVYAAQFVKGLQGDHPRYITANAGCKHFDVHGGPENIPVNRMSFDAKVSERDWRLTYLPAFRACVHAGTYSLMCSYNSINGIPACANHKLLTEILRDEWGFQGYVISDENALENIISDHHYLNTTVDTVAATVNAGCNIELSAGHGPLVFDSMVDAVSQGKLSEILVRERVKPLFYTRMRLGEFDPPEMNPYMQYNLSLVQSLEHRTLAVTAAMQTFVLLKNLDNLLPIKKHLSRIAIVGPMADNLQQLYGTYAADIDLLFAQTPLQGLKGLSDNWNYAAGCKDNKCTDYSGNEIKQAVRDTQLVIICVGTGQELESEDNDRYDMNLAVNQTQLVQDAVSAANGTPVLLLVFSAGPVNISFVERDSRISAIMQCFFPAQATGEALFNTITMATADASPAGRLPYTWYDTAQQVPSMTDYSMTERTYRYFTGVPLYPFGYGLSYTTFQYLKLSLIPTIAAGDNQYVFGQVLNTGNIDAYEVIQLYISWKATNETMPNIQLAGFDRIFVPAGQSQEFKFVISFEQMAIWTDGGYVVQPGTVIVYIGGQQPNQKKTVGSNILQTSFEILGLLVLAKH